MWDNLGFVRLWFAWVYRSKVCSSAFWVSGFLPLSRRLLQVCSPLSFSDLFTFVFSWPLKPFLPIMSIFFELLWVLSFGFLLLFCLELWLVRMCEAGMGSLVLAMALLLLVICFWNRRRSLNSQPRKSIPHPPWGGGIPLYVFGLF